MNAVKLITAHHEKPCSPQGVVSERGSTGHGSDASRSTGSAPAGVKVEILRSKILPCTPQGIIQCPRARQSGHERREVRAVRTNDNAFPYCLGGYKSKCLLERYWTRRQACSISFQQD